MSQQPEVYVGEDGQTYVVQPFISDIKEGVEDAWDWAKDKAAAAAPYAGAIAGGAVGGPAGAFGGYQAGKGIGGMLKGDQQPQGPNPNQPFQGQFGAGAPAFPGGASGGGGAGSGFAQGGADAFGGSGQFAPGSGGDVIVRDPSQGQMTPQMSGWLKGVIKVLWQNPQLAKYLARAFNFVTGHPSHDNFSSTAVKLMADELPDSTRKALYQYMSGLKSPLGAGVDEDVFLALMIAESGYHPEEVCCIKQ